MLSIWRIEKMKNGKFLSLLLIASVAASSLTGCSLGKNKEALSFSEKYLEDVLNVDLEEIRDKLKDEEGVMDYEDHVKDLTVLTTMFGDCEYEQTEYKRNGDEIDIGYTLYIPDFEEVEGEEYDSFEDLLDAVSGLDEKEYEIEFTLVQKKDKWLIKDAESTLELYEDILESISKADIDYTLGYEGTLEILREYYPDFATEFENTEISRYSTGASYDLSYGGIQVVVEEYDRTDAAFNQFVTLAEIWGHDTPSEDVHYCYLDANGQASGIIWNGNVVIHIYDCDGNHYDMVNSILNDLQELI